MVVVPKPKGALRVCIHFHQVNMDIMSDAYTMYRIEDQLDAMAGSTVFFTLELTKGYHQLLLHPYLKPMKTFETPVGLYQWKVLHLEMNNDSEVF